MPSLIFFEVGPQILAIRTEFITEIIRSVIVTPLPEQPKPFSGVINYRGRIVPVVRLGDFSDFKSQSTTLTEYMIIIGESKEDGESRAAKSTEICLVVDQVTAFKTVEEEQLLVRVDNPDIESRLTTQIVKLETGLVPVLEVGALLKPNFINSVQLNVSNISDIDRLA